MDPSSTSATHLVEASIREAEFVLVNGISYGLRSRRVIGDFNGYRRLFAYLALFGREGVGRQCAGKGGCIGF